MNSRRQVLAVCGALFAAMLGAAGVRAADDRDFRQISKNFPAASLKSFRLDARVGSVRVRATNGNDVSLNLELESRREDGWLWGRKGDVRNVELEADASGGILRLSLKGERKGLNEKWVLQVPARLAADIKMDVGDVDALGLAGGARIHVNVGDVNLDVPGGEIEAKVNVGEIKARTASDSYDDVVLETNVGDADLRVGNNRIRNDRRSYGPSDEARWRGTGRDRIRMEVNVGDASLVIAKARV